MRVNRVVPTVAGKVISAAAYKTYGIAAPRGGDHWRYATCAEVDCAGWVNGFQVPVDESTDLGATQAGYIRRECALDGTAAIAHGRRRYTETRSPAGLTVFQFPPGQRCFRSHQVRTGRPELFVVKGGDWRGNPRGVATRLHQRPVDWVEDFSEHQDRVQTARERG